MNEGNVAVALPRRWLCVAASLRDMLRRAVRRTWVPMFVALMCIGLQANPANAAGSTAALYETTLKDTSGKPFDLSRLRGKTTVVNFWASWCGPCVREMPELAVLNDRYAGKKVAFVGIAADSDANVKRFLGNVRVDYLILNAGFEGVELSTKLGNTVHGLPFTVVIDEDGQISYTKLGAISSPELAKALDSSIARRKDARR
ncbi:TlpA family protein disulfide reductase [Chitinasiproducens palmae]|uniref:Thiol-disulfide isomerase or thioredoxin n=1 Tax=Chitinasiproducens palmae TaxID=1770053 RepID=A0A1H2PRL2_9BURK|nr:TlpA disulfide reductase family protein [Chitinasiproducens palmae]SDV49543.1 Thiol-disulfide isomerase or thioredoxin [Chitinasiproducens palmae]